MSIREGGQQAGDPASKPRPTGQWFQTVVGALRTFLGGKASGESMRESLEEFLGEAESGGDELAPEERRMLFNILAFSELKVEDVMVPRADIVAIEEQVPLNELVKVFRDAQHSRLPVYRENLDHPLGMVHIKDLIGLAVPEDPGTKHPDKITDVLRDVLFVPGSMPVVDLLVKMQSTRVHLALVIDEYGGTDGLVSIEDLVEQIVGKIEDEYDTDDTKAIHQRKDGGWDASARATLEEAEQVLSAKLAEPDDAAEIDTLAGLVFHLVGRVPQRGEVIRHPAGFEFDVVDADPRRLKRLRIRRVAAVDSNPAAASEGQSADVKGAVVNG